MASPWCDGTRSLGAVVARSLAGGRALRVDGRADDLDRAHDVLAQVVPHLDVATGRQPHPQTCAPILDQRLEGVCEGGPVGRWDVD